LTVTAIITSEIVYLTAIYVKLYGIIMIQSVCR
jgi:hypothetical protein